MVTARKLFSHFKAAGSLVICDGGWVGTPYWLARPSEPTFKPLDELLADYNLTREPLYADVWTTVRRRADTKILDAAKITSLPSKHSPIAAVTFGGNRVCVESGRNAAELWKRPDDALVSIDARWMKAVSDIVGQLDWHQDSKSPNRPVYGLLDDVRAVVMPIRSDNTARFPWADEHEQVA